MVYPLYTVVHSALEELSKKKAEKTGPFARPKMSVLYNTVTHVYSCIECVFEISDCMCTQSCSCLKYHDKIWLERRPRYIHL